MAIQFNLLPWREEARKKKAQNTKATLVAGLIIGILASGGYYYLKHLELKDNQSAAAFLQAEIKKLESKKKEKIKLDKLREKLISQINAIETLQAKRSSVTHAVEELSKAVPEELFLESFKLQNTDIVISGVAKNESEISTLMRNLNDSTWYLNPVLVTFSRDKDLDEEVKRFTITSKLTSPQEKTTEGTKDGKK